MRSKNVERNFIETTFFTKQWLDLSLDDDALLLLQNRLMKNPGAGSVIMDTGGARKYRFLLPGKGTRGGARVIYVNVVRDKDIHLLFCYAKARQDDLTAEQKKRLKALIAIIKEGKHGQ
jgi:hypothetical protein